MASRKAEGVRLSSEELIVATYMREILKTINIKESVSTNGLMIKTDTVASLKVDLDTVGACFYKRIILKSILDSWCRMTGMEQVSASLALNFTLASIRTTKVKALDSLEPIKCNFADRWSMASSTGVATCSGLVSTVKI